MVPRRAAPKTMNEVDAIYDQWEGGRQDWDITGSVPTRERMGSFLIINFNILF